MPDAIVFDDGLGKLGPLTALRPAFDVRTGAMTTLQRLTRTLDLQVLGFVVTPGLAELASQTHDVPARAPDRLPPVAAGTLAVSGRCVLPPDEIEQLEPGQTLVEKSSGHIVAARLRSALDYPAFFGAYRPTDWVVHCEDCLLHRPWHVRTFRDQALTTDLLELAAGGELDPIAGVTIFGENPVLIRDDEGARVYPGVIIDAEHGPVLIDEHATVRPGATIIGPAYIGRHATVLDRALIKANTSIGPWCKVAGEVGGTIFQGYANKGHDGHLGDSYVGEWANLGAGTTNSNLLNTYGEVLMRASVNDPLEKTGQQFMGCIIGDHVKTAICTRLMTGVTLDTGAMFAMTASASGNIPPFAWCTDDTPPGARAFRLDKFLDIARTVMARRKVTPSEAYIARLTELHSRGAESAERGRKSVGEVKA
jgi:UDP-N-acetylglucosamine diphosphorylase/glucosamine-1-phosphate N-acetyltransferase